jgi:putative nucleotidyltransferase with HDIG domain
MTEAVQFLTGFAQALATMTLYREGHPARSRVIELAYQALLDLQAREPTIVFTFLGDEIICGNQPLRELKHWDWSTRLSRAGIQRLEFEPDVQADDFVAFLNDVLTWLTTGGSSSAEARPERPSRIKFGPVGIKGEPDAEVTTVTVNYSLGVEAETVRWLHSEVKDRNRLHLAEAEAVVRSLSVAMYGDSRIVIPLLKLREYDEYTTTHALNVSVLAMALAQFLGLGPRDVRAFGVSGLLHDIGKTRVPHDILIKPGKLDDHERALINRHTEDGARIIIETEEHLDLAAVVAYEHHIMIDGGGYPSLRFRRNCHYASRIVHVCDVYDALRTNRPYRAAWPAQRVLNYISERTGSEFDPEVAPTFVEMMHKWELQVMELTAEDQSLTLGAALSATLASDAPAPPTNGTTS